MCAAPPLEFPSPAAARWTGSAFGCATSFSETSFSASSSLTVPLMIRERLSLFPAWRWRRVAVARNGQSLASLEAPLVLLAEAPKDANVCFVLVMATFQRWTCPSRAHCRSSPTCFRADDGSRSERFAVRV